MTRKKKMALKAEMGLGRATSIEFGKYRRREGI